MDVPRLQTAGPLHDPLDVEGGPAPVVAFWREAGRARWFRRDPAFDEEVRRRFEGLCLRAARGDLQAWGAMAQGALALLLLLDQFPRNMYRGSAQAFASDPLALTTAEAAVAASLDLQVGLELQPFFYLPFEHQETASAQRRGVELAEAFVRRGGEDSYLRYARLHEALIGRFGRFPHRNAVLGRPSTPEETAYLAEGGFTG
jgi:uncharacterized protein (DUF924 family)